MAKVGRKLLSYDECQALTDETKYRLENWDEKEEGEPKPDKDELEGRLAEDCTTIDLYWEDCQQQLNEIIQRKNPNGYWKAEVSNFGWRRLDGHKYFQADNAIAFLQAILPRTDCTFYVFNYGKGLALQNFHHDSPVGKEWYYITPIAYSTYANNS